MFQKDKWSKDPGPSDLVKMVKTLPTLPVVVSGLLEALSDDRTSAAELRALVEHDQGLCGKVLAVANSPYYGFPYQIASLERALVVLGRDELRKTCLGAALSGFIFKSLPSEDTTSQNLWIHSLTVAEASRIVAEQSGMVEPDEAYTAGLVHDLGKVVLFAYLPNIAGSLRLLMENLGVSYRQAERVLGWDHEDIGLCLAEHWSLPPLIAEVMARHHEPYPGLEHLGMVCAVHVADCISRGLAPQGGIDTDCLLIDPLAVSTLRLGGNKLEACGRMVRERSEAIESLWRALGGGSPRPKAAEGFAPKVVEPKVAHA